METDLRVLCDVAIPLYLIGEHMTDRYYWHISETKQRAYLCPYPQGTMAPPDNPEQMAWGEWIGYVNSNGIVAMRHGPWPSWKEVARLKLRKQSERLDAAKLILLSLKGAES